MTTTCGVDAEARCICWDGPVVLHEGHCCFDAPAGGIKAGRPLPCGHCVHEMRPAVGRDGAQVCTMCGHEDTQGRPGFDIGTPARCYRCGDKNPRQSFGDGGYVWACQHCPHPSEVST